MDNASEQFELPRHLQEKERIALCILYARDEKRYSDANTMLWECVIAAGEHPHAADLYMRLSRLFVLQRHWHSAEVAIRDAIKISKVTRGVIAPETARLRAKLVQILHGRFRTEHSALALWRRAVRKYFNEEIELLAAPPAPEPRHALVLKAELALFLVEVDWDKQEALDSLVEMFPRLLAASGLIGDNPAGEAAKALGLVFLKREQYGQAATYFNYALRLLSNDRTAISWLKDRLFECEHARFGADGW